MWRGYEEALISYGEAICEQWTRLGYSDTVKDKLLAYAPGGPQPQEQLTSGGRVPPWLGDLRVHRSHQSALLRKDPGWYRQYFPDIPDDLPYFWPV
jgi:hypothetical protein